MLRFCNYPGCQRLAMNASRCADHRNSHHQRPERDAWYQKRAWRDVVRPYKLRHDPICEDCKEKPATDVHHRDGSWKATGDWRLFIDQNNLLSLCHECHSRRTMKDNHESR